MKVLYFILAFVMNVIPSGKALWEPLQKRDSILVGDQFVFGFTLDDVKPGTVLALPDMDAVSSDTLTLVRGWQIDTLSKPRKPLKIRASVVVAPFEEGKYLIPSLPVLLSEGENVDTLLFDAVEMEVMAMPVDTATFVVKDLKDIRRYPLTFRETVPWGLGAAILAALVWLLVRFLRKRRKESASSAVADPPHIVALRKLDKYRGDKFWAPDKQKLFYSGITDALKEYIDARFGIDAPEMTTAELFDAMKGTKELSPELFAALKDMFGTADFVKFAKLTVGDEENAKALPLAVRFVTETYRKEMEEENNVL